MADQAQRGNHHGHRLQVGESIVINNIVECLAYAVYSFVVRRGWPLAKRRGGDMSEALIMAAAEAWCHVPVGCNMRVTFR